MLPEKTVAVVLHLAPQHKASRSARSMPSTLKLDFTVAKSAAAAGPVEQISDSQGAPAFTLPSPPPTPDHVSLWPFDTIAMDQPWLILMYRLQSYCAGA